MCVEKNNRGQAIILVMVIIVLLLTVSITCLSLCKSQEKTVIYQREKVQAYYNADSGIERVVSRLKKDPGWAEEVPGYLVTFYKDDKMIVKVRKEETELFIRSTGRCSRCKKNLEACMKLDPLKVLSWKEKYPVLPD
ncbi:MAG: hypothetical protein K9L17_00420 [Clostridiales bacterium]|nr:hypothetical protein [Clostridiales bacterium]MCF8021155.1 hypothetical protein [Clostridiales bacterium]